MVRKSFAVVVDLSKIRRFGVRTEFQMRREKKNWRKGHFQRIVINSAPLGQGNFDF